MSLFRTGGSRSAALQPDFSGLAIQTAAAAAPIPVVWGQTRVAPNIIWRDGVSAVPQYANNGGKSGGAGKGGGSGSRGPDSYEYFTWIAFAIGEGPINGVAAIHNGQGVYTPGSFGLGLVPGTTPQQPWAPGAARFPYSALSYPGTAYLASSSFDLGSAASLPSISFEVQGIGQGATSWVNGLDSDPATLVADFLTNPQYGVGFPAASLDATALFGTAASSPPSQGTNGDGSYQSYCRSAGLALSPALVNTEKANAVLARWLQLTNAAAVWSGGRLKIVPFGDAPLAGNGGSYTPAATASYDLDDDAFVAADGQDPVEVTRCDGRSLANVQRLECFDRANSYAATPVEARDQNGIEQFGLNTGSTITAHEICDLSVGVTAAQLILQRGLYIRNTFQFKLSWEYCLLEPMDLVTLTDLGLGLARTAVRVTRIEEAEDGLLAVTAEEYPTGAATAGAVVAPSNAAVRVDRNIAAAPVNPPVILEPPSQLTGGVPQLWLAASGGRNGIADPNWGGALVWASRDGTSFAQVGQITERARQGTLAAPLPAFAGANPDGVDTLAVDLTMSGGALIAASPADAASGLTLSLAGDEILAYAGATLTAANRYALTGLQRGLDGSVAAAHPAGTRFARLDNAVLRTVLPANAIGTTVTLKLQSFNIFGGGLQDLATCTAYPVTPIGSGLFGPIASAIAAGTSFDEGLASAAVTQTDDYGIASDPYTAPADMGLASDAAASLAVASGGTGATSTGNARTSLGAAAAGANIDITSLTNLAGLAINTTVDTAVNLFSCRSANALFDNVGAGTQVALNRAGGASSATHLYETGYSGRALAGLLGSDRYRVAVSATGAAFAQAIDVDPASGHIGLAGYTADGNNALGVLGSACLFAAATDSMRFTFSKVGAASDATLSFQTAFSARALLGTTGSDAFQLKVSPDGSSFFQAFVVDQTTGNTAFKALIGTASYTVAALPASAFNGALAFATNGRKSSEAAGAGSGVLATFSKGAWRRLSDDSVVAA